MARLVLSAPTGRLCLLALLLAGLARASRPQEASLLQNPDSDPAPDHHEAPDGKGDPAPDHREAEAQAPEHADKAEGPAPGEPFKISMGDGKNLDGAVKALEDQVSKSSDSAHTVQSDFQKYQATIKELQGYLDKFSDEQRKYNKDILMHFVEAEPERMKAFNEAKAAAEQHGGAAGAEQQKGADAGAGEHREAGPGAEGSAAAAAAAASGGAAGTERQKDAKAGAAEHGEAGPGPEGPAASAAAAPGGAAGPASQKEDAELGSELKEAAPGAADKSGGDVKDDKEEPGEPGGPPEATLVQTKGKARADTDTKVAVVKASGVMLSVKPHAGARAAGAAARRGASDELPPHGGASPRRGAAGI